jgi:hypothetical protein
MLCEIRRLQFLHLLKQMLRFLCTILFLRTRRYPTGSPGISFWSSANQNDNLSYAAPISPELVSIQTWTGHSSVVVYIQGGGLTWDDIGVIHIACNFCKDPDPSGDPNVLVSVIVENVMPGQVLMPSFQKLRSSILSAASAQRLLASPPPPFLSRPPPTSSNFSSGPASEFRNCIQGVADRLNMCASLPSLFLCLHLNSDL